MPATQTHQSVVVYSDEAKEATMQMSTHSEKKVNGRTHKAAKQSKEPKHSKAAKETKEAKEEADKRSRSDPRDIALTLLGALGHITDKAKREELKRLEPSRHTILKALELLRDAKNDAAVDLLTSYAEAASIALESSGVRGREPVHVGCEPRRYFVQLAKEGAKVKTAPWVRLPLPSDWDLPANPRVVVEFEKDRIVVRLDTSKLTADA